MSWRWCLLLDLGLPSPAEVLDDKQHAMQKNLGRGLEPADEAVVSAEGIQPGLRARRLVSLVG